MFDRLNGLHDTKIQFIRYSSASQKLILVYENGNIDLIYPDNEVVNMKQLKDKNYPNLVINNVSVVNEKAYICTNFGIVVENMDKEEFEATYDLKLNVHSCTADAHYIYLCCSENGFHIGNLKLNLLDKNNWKHISGNFFHELTFFKDELIGFNKTTGLFIVDQQHYTTTALTKGANSFFSCSEDVMLTGNSSSIYLFNNITDKQEVKQDNLFNYLVYSNDTYWASQGIKGLQPYVLSGKALSATQSAIQPNSPIRDYFCNMHYNGNRLLIAGGDLNYNGIDREGTVMYYENGTWYNFNEDGIIKQTNVKYTNTSSIAQDPSDPTHHYVSSAGHGLYEFKDFKFIKRYDYTNSPLQTILPDSPRPQDYVRCDALQYDTEGNLWMVNSEVDTILTILKKDNTWTKLYYEELKKAPNLPAMFFDDKGRLWVLSKRNSTNKAGVFVLDYHGTLEDTSDDIHIIRKDITNQDGVQYDPYYFNSFAQDLNKQIWVGTNEGLFVIEEPENASAPKAKFTALPLPCGKAAATFAGTTPTIPAHNKLHKPCVHAFILTILFFNYRLKQTKAKIQRESIKKFPKKRECFAYFGEMQATLPIRPGPNSGNRWLQLYGEARQFPSRPNPQLYEPHAKYGHKHGLRAEAAT